MYILSISVSDHSAEMTVVFNFHDFFFLIIKISIFNKVMLFTFPQMKDVAYKRFYRLLHKGDLLPKLLDLCLNFPGTKQIKALS